MIMSNSSLESIIWNWALVGEGSSQIFLDSVDHLGDEILIIDNFFFLNLYNLEKPPIINVIAFTSRADSIEYDSSPGHIEVWVCSYLSVNVAKLNLDFRKF